MRQPAQRDQCARGAAAVGPVPRRQLAVLRDGRGHHCAARCRRMHAQHDGSACQRTRRPRPPVTAGKEPSGADRKSPTMRFAASRDCETASVPAVRGLPNIREGRQLKSPIVVLGDSSDQRRRPGRHLGASQAGAEIPFAGGSVGCYPQNLRSAAVFGRGLHVRLALQGCGRHSGWMLDFVDQYEAFKRRDPRLGRGRVA